MKRGNLTALEALEVSRDWVEQPMFNKVIITLNVSTNLDELDLSGNTMDEFQYVVAKGTSCHNIEVGDKVRLDLNKLMKSTINPNNSHENLTTIELDPIEFEDRIYAIIDDRVIKTRFINTKDLQTEE